MTGAQRSAVARAAALYIGTVEWIAALAMGALVAVAALQVFFRYVVNDSLFWSEELMRYLMIWTAFLTSGIVYSRGGFLGMRVFVDATPARVRRIIDVIGRLAVLGFLAVVAWYGMEFAVRTAAMKSVALEFSMFWMHVSVPVGSVLMMLHVIAQIIAPPPAFAHDDLPQAI